jgi:hypothetical protein
MILLPINSLRPVFPQSTIACGKPALLVCMVELLMRGIRFEKTELVVKRGDDPEWRLRFTAEEGIIDILCVAVNAAQIRDELEAAARVAFIGPEDERGLDL